MHKGQDSVDNVIAALRFPLMVGIVFSHTLAISLGTYRCYDFFFTLITRNMASVCVPLFFLISGFLFFRGLEVFEFEKIQSKIIRRIKTLAVPYMLWNIIVLLSILIVQVFFPCYTTGAFPNVLSLSFVEFVKMFYDANGSTQPICFQLWFLRDLILLVCISPILWFLLRYVRELFLFALFIAYIAQIKRPIICVSFMGLFFYALGAYFSLFKRSLLNRSRNKTIFFVCLWISYCFLSSIIHLDCDVHRLCVIVGCFGVFWGTQLLICNNARLLNWLRRGAKTSFFMYASHGLIITLLVRIVSAHVVSDLTATIAYFGCVLTTIFIVLLLYKILYRFCPKILTVVVGGRL